MDIQTEKLDIINWLINLNDESVINKIKALKSDNQIPNSEVFFNEYPNLKSHLDARLEEKTENFTSGRSALKKIRAKYEL
jgi:hypothetical protein